MKIYTFPHVTTELNQFTISNSTVNDNLFQKITNKKDEIDAVQHKWDSAKKISNDYEYIYTSSNYIKNISSFIPVSRSFFKLREVIYDFKLNISGKCACIAEAPGGFMQSLLTFSKEHKIDIGVLLLKNGADMLVKNKNKRTILSTYDFEKDFATTIKLAIDKG